MLYVPQETDVVRYGANGQARLVETLYLSHRQGPDGPEALYADRWFPLAGPEYSRQIYINPRPAS